MPSSSPPSTPHDVLPDESSLITEKSTSRMRWVILLLGCLMMVGSYYCFDIPAALKTQLEDQMGSEGDAFEVEFSLLYTLYAAPNVILPFFGGYFVDKLGFRICLLVFSSLIAGGQAIFSFGVSLKSWPVVYLGRLIFGFGGESFSVANAVLLTDWFKGKELALAFGINLAISKLGSVINNVLSPLLASSMGIIFAMWFGTIVCLFSVVCVILTIPIDRAMDKLIEKNKSVAAFLMDAPIDDGKDISALRSISTENPLTLAAIRVSVTQEAVLGAPRHHDLSMCKTSEEGLTLEKQAPSLKDVLTLKKIFWVLVISCAVVYGSIIPFNNISSSLLLERDYFKLPADGCALYPYPNACQNTTNVPNSQCQTSKWYQPPLPAQYSASDVDCTDDFWSAVGGCTYDYCNKLEDAEFQASYMMSIPYIISAALSPPLGMFVDKYGYRAVVAAIAPALILVVHLMLGLTNVDCIYPLIGQGLAYTGFVSVLWPAIPLVVEERVSGLAFGIVTSVMNLSCAVVPLIAATIYNNSDSLYIPNVELLFASFGAVGFLVGLYMNYYDYKHDSVLNRGVDSDVIAHLPVSESSDLRKSLLHGE